MGASTVVVAGALGVKPGNGGEAWVRLSWFRGLLQLGLDAWFVEELPPGLASPDSAEVAWFDSIVHRFGIADRALLASFDGTSTVGPVDQLRDVLRGADLLVNISGNLRQPELLSLPRRTAYVDLDPGFTQVWAEQGIDLGLQRHDLHFTVGENIGTSRCPLPTAGFRWHPCRQPVLLDDWPATPPEPDGALTTVATWRCSFGPVEWNATTYGLKLHEFRKLIDLPSRSPGTPFELALDMHPEDHLDRTRLSQHGWRSRPATEVANTPEAFRRYVQGSLGEFTAVQGIYAYGRTGWIGDRSVRYLASARPVVVQDTALAADLPVGEGLLVFDDLASAVDATRRVTSDLDQHSIAARALAESYFDAKRVLGDFLERADVSA